VENAFGIMAARFRIYRTQINLELKHIESVVMASCALHNFLITSLPHCYAPSECFDCENLDEGSVKLGLTARDSTMERMQTRNLGNVPRTAKQIREEFMSYFVNEGQVPWQNNFVH
jgi:hypothetical protein